MAITAFWKQICSELRSLLVGAFFAVLAIIPDSILLFYLWQKELLEAIIVLLLIRAILCTAMLLFFCKGIVSGYKNIKYYLFSPYR